MRLTQMCKHIVLTCVCVCACVLASVTKCVCVREKERPFRGWSVSERESAVVLHSRGVKIPLASTLLYIGACLGSKHVMEHRCSLYRMLFIVCVFML